jgi:hypothetical protein
MLQWTWNIAQIFSKIDDNTRLVTALRNVFQSVRQMYVDMQTPTAPQPTHQKAIAMFYGVEILVTA